MLAKKKTKEISAQLGIEPRLLALRLKLAGTYTASVIPLDHCAFHVTNLHS